ncbi:MAG: four helix bundle protein [Candidatus Hatepunaea meridiana]|nr:four helix bundle protein [Candidatus Hatepunaea meridiana]
MNKGFKRVEEIEVWKRGCRLTVEIYKATLKEPFSKDWGLKDQKIVEATLLSLELSHFKDIAQATRVSLLLFSKGIISGIQAIPANS